MVFKRNLFEPQTKISLTLLVAFYRLTTPHNPGPQFLSQQFNSPSLWAQPLIADHVILRLI